MSDLAMPELLEQLHALRVENARLQTQADALADANVHAAELVVALEEAQEREAHLRKRGEELDLQTRLDAVLQHEDREGRLLEHVGHELSATEGLQLRQAVRIIDRRDSALWGQLPPIALTPVLSPLGTDRLLVPIQTGDGVIGALELFAADTDAAWVARWVPLLWSIGRQIGVAITRLRAEDENVRMTADLILARDQALESSRTKSSFLANMSHELRTPMNAIIGYSEMLIEEADDLAPEEFIPDLRKIQTAGKHLLSLINDVLDLSKLEAGKMNVFVESFPVRQLLDEISAMIQPQLTANQNRLVIECPDDIGNMVADVVKVRQTMFNLVGNASKFTEQGLITLRVSSVTRDDIERLEFAVQDTGIGMTPPQIAKLFQAFVQADGSTTRKYGGTGLGLTISRRFCQIMGGDIRVASELGVGSVFTVDLPRVVANPDSNTAEFAVQAPAPVGPHDMPVRGRILAIDDNREALEIIQRGLAREGYWVMTALSGEDGLMMARRERPDVITLDVMMPSMNGWDVLTAIKADPSIADIPVVLLSVVENREIGMALGAAECLTKPIDWLKLDALLAHLTAHREPA